MPIGKTDEGLKREIGGDYQLDRAIDACLAIKTKLQELPADHGFKPSVSIGINSGEMISENIGSATLKRLDYTVIGNTVNTAQRLQSVAEENQIPITEKSYQLVKESFNCKPVGNKMLKNKLHEYMLFEVIN